MISMSEAKKRKSTRLLSKQIRTARIAFDIYTAAFNVPSRPAVSPE